MSYDFYVARSVAAKINEFRISEYEKEVIRRCVGGYSDPASITDRMQKYSYALGQGMNQYWPYNSDPFPDWKSSVKSLNTVSITKNGTVPFAELLSPLPTAIVNNGEAMLKELIKTNNQWIARRATALHNMPS